MKSGFIATAFALTLLSSVTQAQACDWYDCIEGTDDVAKGVVCKVKDVVALTQSDKDCKTLGGEVVKKGAAAQEKK